MLALITFGGASPVAASSGGYQNFAWLHDPNSDFGWGDLYEPDHRYATLLPGRGTAIVSMHESTGEYVVTTCTPPQMMTQVQVVAYGDDGVRCKLSRASHPHSTFLEPNTGTCVDSTGAPIWGLRSYVSCKTAAGAAADSRFVIQVTSGDTTRLRGPAGFLETTGGGRRIAKTWVVRTDGLEFFRSNVNNIYNSQGFEHQPTITRWSEGTYRVTFPRLGSLDGVVQVTAVGSDAVYCKPNGAPFTEAPDRSALQINVRCFRRNTPTDSDFNLNYDRYATRATGSHQAAHAFAHISTSTTAYTPARSYNTGATERAGSAANTVLHPARGQYFVQHSDLYPRLSSAYVVASGAGSEYCKLAKWFPDGSKTTVEVLCFDHTGNRADVPFMETYQGTILGPD